MHVKTIDHYVCDWCGREFDAERSCENHEPACLVRWNHEAARIGFTGQIPSVFTLKEWNSNQWKWLREFTDGPDAQSTRRVPTWRYSE